MMPRRLATAVLVLACAGSAGSVRAQNRNARFALGGEAGLVARSVRDDALAPVASSGGGLELGLRSRAVVGPLLITVRASASAALAADRFGDEALAFGHALLGRATLFLPHDGGFWLAVGGAIGSDAVIGYFPRWDDTHAYWITHHWLGASADAWRPLSRDWRIDLSADVSLAGLVARPPGYRYQKVDPLPELGFYFAGVGEDPRATWIGETQRLQLTAELWRSRSHSYVASGWGFGADLTFLHTSAVDSAWALTLCTHVMGVWSW